VSLIQIVVFIIVIGVLVWLANQYLPMEPRIKSILNGFAVVAVLLIVVLWLLAAAGLLGIATTPVHFG
jgi:uncharacterized membrane protein (DUF441 family)